ncbi:FAD-binding domain-containing protein [Aspergillus indologenus CBS 114.80]|uniref:FAD-binding domain-containing protein n=1 Tax=Aspergillus indologenus CBS 114.80 TaxID=1450541 RepID=A0A2V5IHT2_9EURO|nr:FAD-binding domain-containing protein [Aspergillus indologenus CBS 114.80]
MTNTTAQKAIQLLQETFSAAQVLLPSIEEYTTLNGSYLSALESDLTPACIFQPRSAEEVSQFVKTLVPLGVPFAVRGAGQQPLPGCANIDGGITLDLGLLTGVKINENESVSVAAGERWGTVYDALSSQNLGVCGARSSKGGIGGLALSGGLSFFSSREGLISDNILNYEIILASGAIVQANATDNPSLWTALRGGGNNFGIVTRFDLRTFPQDSFWAGVTYYFPASFPAQIEALVQELQNPGAEAPDTHYMISTGYAAMMGGAMCMNQVYYTGASDAQQQPPAVLQRFSTAIEPQVPQISSVAVQSLSQAAQGQAAAAMDQLRCAYFNTTVKADADTLKAAADLYMAALEPIHGVEGLICSLTLQPYPTSLLEKSEQQGGNSLGLTAAEGPLVSLLLLSYWKNSSDDAAVLGVMQTALAKIKAEATARGQHVPFEFLNYAWSSQDPFASYGSENKSQLQAVSREFDPEGVFQKLVPGGFKLFA